jgi:hypothetical protein
MMTARDKVLLGVQSVFAAVAGLACIIGPYLYQHGLDASSLMPAPLFPLARTAWEKLAFVPTLIALGLTGAVLGFLQPKYWWVVGMATMALMPIAAILEMFKDPTSHNLWPLEFILYGMVNTPSLLASFAGSQVRTRIERKNEGRP